MTETQQRMIRYNVKQHDLGHEIMYVFDLVEESTTQSVEHRFVQRMAKLAYVDSSTSEGEILNFYISEARKICGIKDEEGG